MAVSWFNDLPLPSLTPSQLETLNHPIFLTEVLKVISSLKNTSSPGPDGFSATYYKKFSAQLSPRLVWLFNSVLKGGSFPEEMLLAKMSLIPKPNRDHTLPQNYRSISVINNDLKIFGRILADRLGSVISSLISPYQSGFIPHRLITDNICLVSNIIRDATISSRKLFMLSLEIHKAFDCVSWKFISLLLQRFGFQSEFLGAFRDPST